MVEPVEKGQVIAIYKPPVPGEDGMSRQRQTTAGKESEGTSAIKRTRIYQTGRWKYLYLEYGWQDRYGE